MLLEREKSPPVINKMDLPSIVSYLASANGLDINIKKKIYTTVIRSAFIYGIEL